ncbi:MAG: murein biosynthesis integral membrane protein MurJ [Syntrophomonadaceae bacterium]|nr:murein biosynthesis integral membrane protein MurJ [Syntrophomonadaceae bacterium]
MAHTGRHMARAAFLLMVTVILSRVLGYGREVALYTLFGQNYITDAYRAAFSVPDLIYMLLVGGALSSALIPVLSSYLANGEEEEGWEALSILTSWVLRVMLLLIALAYFYTRPLIILLTPGLPEEYINLAAGLTHIMLVQTFFMALNGLAMGVLNSCQHFASPALGSLVYNAVIIIVGCLGYKQWGIAAFAYGVALGAALNLAVQIPALKRVGVRYRFTLRTDHPGFVKILGLMIPVMAGLGVAQLNLFVTQNIASHLGSGVLSSLNLAQRIMNLPVGIFAVSIGTALFPTLASLIAQGEMEGFRRYTSLGIRATLLLGVPASLGLFAIGQPLVSLLFEQGEFTGEMVQATTQALNYYLWGLAAYACMQVAVRGFYALKAPVIPVISAVLAVLVNVVLSIQLGYRWGAPGLALAYSIAGWLDLLILLAALRWKVGPMGGSKIVRGFVISVFAGVIMFFAVMGVINGLTSVIIVTSKGAQALLIGAATAVGVLVYAPIIMRFRLEETKIIMNLLGNRWA